MQHHNRRILSSSDDAADDAARDSPRGEDGAPRSLYGKRLPPLPSERDAPRGGTGGERDSSPPPENKDTGPTQHAPPDPRLAADAVCPEPGTHPAPCAEKTAPLSLSARAREKQRAPPSGDAADDTEDSGDTSSDSDGDAAGTIRGRRASAGKTTVHLRKLATNLHDDSLLLRKLVLPPGKQAVVTRLLQAAHARVREQHALKFDNATLLRSPTELGRDAGRFQQLLAWSVYSLGQIQEAELLVAELLSKAFAEDNPSPDGPQFRPTIDTVLPPDADELMPWPEILAAVFFELRQRTLLLESTLRQHGDMDDGAPGLSCKKLLEIGPTAAVDAGALLLARMRTAVRKDKPLHAPSLSLRRAPGGGGGNGGRRRWSHARGGRDSGRRDGEKAESTRAKGTGAKH